MTPTVTRCVSCGMEGYDIAPRKSHGGRRRKDGSPAQSQFCRWCWDKRTQQDSQRALNAARLAYRERFVVGPAICQGCRTRVYWRRRWTKLDGSTHLCAA